VKLIERHVERAMICVLHARQAPIFQHERRKDTFQRPSAHQHTLSATQRLGYIGMKGCSSRHARHRCLAGGAGDLLAKVDRRGVNLLTRKGAREIENMLAERHGMFRIKNNTTVVGVWHDPMPSDLR
jgi:hypothetical protein